MADRTVGVTFCGPDGRVYRPSMFVTLTLPSYGKVHHGIPTDPDGYRYRRAALDAVLFPRLVDQFFKNLRRCAGFDVQYFSVVEPQKRGAPHLHAAVRGAIPRAILRQVVAATYVQVWWPPFHTPVYGEDDQPPVWDGSDYVDPTTGVVLPTWRRPSTASSDDPDARPAHVLRFGKQLDIRGIIAPSPDADRAIRYLVKYLTKSVTEPFTNPDCVDFAYEAHVDRLHEELRFLPCSEQCANWLRYGLQPKDRGPWPGAGPVLEEGPRAGVSGPWVAGGCWCRGSGRARRCRGIALTVPWWSARCWRRPACPPRRSTGSLPTSAPRKASPGSSGRSSSTVPPPMSG